MTVLAYGAQLLIAIPVMMRFGLVGYLVTWCINEILQLFYLLQLNARLFGETAKVDRTPVYQLFGFLAVGVAIFLWPVYHIAGFSDVTQGAIAIVATVVTLAVSYWIFRVDEVRSLLWQKVAGRFPSLASRRG
jgi:hypothetical protein